MRTGTVILFIVFITAGCKNKNRIPSDVFPRQKMQSVLWDMMRADQFLADYVLNKDSALDKTIESLRYYQQVFAIHKITREEFQHSFSYYRSHPVLFRAIMDSINTSGKGTPASQLGAEPVTTPVIVSPGMDPQNKDSMPQDTAALRARKDHLRPVD